MEHKGHICNYKKQLHQNPNWNSYGEKRFRPIAFFSLDVVLAYLKNAMA